MSEKPKLERNACQHIVDLKLPISLGADFERYSSGSMLMTMSKATFKGDGVEGTMCVDMGGTVVEVSLGSRRWRIKLADLIPAVMEADLRYLES